MHLHIAKPNMHYASVVENSLTNNDSLSVEIKPRYAGGFFLVGVHLEDKLLTIGSGRIGVAVVVMGVGDAQGKGRLRVILDRRNQLSTANHSFEKSVTNPKRNVFLGVHEVDVASGGVIVLLHHKENRVVVLNGYVIRRRATNTPETLAIYNQRFDRTYVWVDELAQLPYFVMANSPTPHIFLGTGSQEAHQGKRR